MYAGARRLVDYWRPRRRRYIVLALSGGELMMLSEAALMFPGWRPHLSLLGDANSNELIVLRWLHVLFGITWIGLLYFFNWVAMPSMRRLEADVRVKVYPVLMSRAMAWFRWSALVTVVLGLRYFFKLLLLDARSSGQPGLVMRWFGSWLLVWLVAYACIYGLQRPTKGWLDSAWARTTGIMVVVVAAAWWVLALNGGPVVSNAHLAISVGGGLGLVMLLNTWGVVWRVQKKLIAWTRAAAEQGTPLPPETQRMMRWGFITARVSLWLSFPMLFFMAAASHYPFLSIVPR